MDTATTVLKVENLSVALDNHPILEKVSFNVQQGDVTAIVGPNGAGKSTLFRALLGLIPYTGKITWQDTLTIGYVPQRLTIEHDFPINVSEFLKLKGAGHKELHEVLSSVGLPGEIHARALGVLSGGELQRVLIAWALVGNPDILLFDEPTAGVDIGGEQTIYHLLHELKRQRNLTILLITHDDHVVNERATNVLELNKKMIYFGTALTYHHDHPAHH